MDKLQKFREKLQERRLDGFIVPMSDEFQNEYVPPYNRRLEWLTGFTGSAGTAIILSDKAAFFTDGRYTIQAANQINNINYLLNNIADMQPYKWLSENADKEKNIGIDSWLHTEDEYQKYKKAAEDKKFDLIDVKIPVDDIWDDRPYKSSRKIFIYNTKYSGQPSDIKISNIVNMLKKSDSYAVILSLPESVCWLLNIRGNDLPHTPFVLCYAIIYSDGFLDLYVDEEKLTEEVRSYMGKNVRIRQIENILQDIKKLKEKKIHIDPAVSPAKFFRSLEEAGAKIIRKQDPCILTKACKNKVEIEGAKKAHLKDGAALCKFLCWLEENIYKKKITEISAGDKLLEFRKQNENFIGPSFDTISAVGANGAIVHYRADKNSDKALDRKSLYLLDSGGQYLEGTTDVTRTISLGIPSNKQKEHFTLVLKGHIAVARVIFPEGTSGHALDSLARYNLWQHGLDYDHGTGHGVGSFLNVHEGPQRISKAGNNVALKPGMIISNEPGFYLENEYGIRIESLVTVISHKKYSEIQKKFLCFETLTLVPIDLRLINEKMLNEEEIMWLNKYHKRVREKISPLVDIKTKKWLAARTRNL